MPARSLGNLSRVLSWRYPCSQCPWCQGRVGRWLTGVRWRWRKTGGSKPQSKQRLSHYWGGQTPQDPATSDPSPHSTTLKRQDHLLFLVKWQFVCAECILFSSAENTFPHCGSSDLISWECVCVCVWEWVRQCVCVCVALPGCCFDDYFHLCYCVCIPDACINVHVFIKKIS